MFKVLVEMSSQIGDNYKKGGGHASARGAEGSDFTRQLLPPAEPPASRSEHGGSKDEQKSWWGVL